MTEKKETVLIALTSAAILSRPDVFVPKKYKDPATGVVADKANYSAKFILAPDHPDLAGIRKAIVKVAQAAKPGIDLRALNHCLGKGDDEIAKAKQKQGANYAGDADWLAGTAILGAKTGEKFPPVLSVLDKGTNIQSIDKGAVQRGWLTLSTPDLKARYTDLFFFGAEVAAEVVIYWYPGFGGGVSAYLQKVGILGGGTRHSGGRSTSEAFSGFAGNISNESVVGNQDDDLPF